MTTKKLKQIKTKRKPVSHCEDDLPARSENKAFGASAKADRLMGRAQVRK